MERTREEPAIKKIPFVKYTSCGNNFVIVDDIMGGVLSETEMSRFAYQATSTAFGIGSDNLLLIQSCTEDTLDAIASERHYWDALPDSSRVEFVFRMFEPTGDEALCCGNGLMCIADYLYRCHGIKAASIMAEMPFSVPRVLAIGSSAGASSWVNLGHPRRTPMELVTPGVALPFDDTIDFIAELSIKFRKYDLKPFTEDGTLTLSGYLVFTGEPHLVVFPDRHFSVPDLADSLFAPSIPSSPDSVLIHGPVDFGSWLVHRIGSYINTQFLDLFPAGLNVNFARLHEPGVIEYRCYERGINRETLACGTGALAVAYVFQQLHGLKAEAIDVLPHRCRWHDAEARIQVQQTNNGWLLNASPVMLFEGTYQLISSDSQFLRADLRDYSIESYSPQAKRPLTQPATYSSAERDRFLDATGQTLAFEPDL